MSDSRDILPNVHFQAQFAALKNQVSPHFLFNSLSVLSSLVRKDPDLSEQFIDHMARVYRYLLEQKDDQLVTLGTEIEFARSYAFIQEVRFARKFKVHFECNEAAASLTLLPFTLQLLIENAIRHNRMSASEPLTVTICTRADGQLVVSNNLQIRSVPDRTIPQGLSTICQRYEMYTEQVVQVTESSEQFQVTVPLLPSNYERAEAF
ncbi:sensor histidine kinase [Telluribacter sp. SYSU D00476]|uniref:sensor histidine kinase n=1 Tax=Telluribacter sp. SYSU D00476 TaxID=2811430 RepID=UPI001FF2A5A2|nr:histidine kinase [Telluribacter sp. SYSU D00476]